jgi:hypothetical protein
MYTISAIRKDALHYGRWIEKTSQGKFGFPLISWTNFYPQAKLFAPKLTNRTAM